jgi:hypothetical protein
VAAIIGILDLPGHHVELSIKPQKGQHIDFIWLLDFAPVCVPANQSGMAKSVCVDRLKP